MASCLVQVIVVARPFLLEPHDGLALTLIYPPGLLLLRLRRRFLDGGLALALGLLSGAGAATTLGVVLECRPHLFVVLQLALADAGDELALRGGEVGLGHHDGQVGRRGVVVEEVGRRHGAAAAGREGLDLGVHGGGLARHGLEHGVAAEGVEVGARVREG